MLVWCWSGVVDKPTLAEHLVFAEYVQADDVYGPVREDCHAAVQSQKAVSAHFTSEQIPPFGFAGQRTPPKWHPYIAQVYREKRREISQRVAPLCGFHKPRGLWSGSSAIVPAPSEGGGGRDSVRRSGSDPFSRGFNPETGRGPVTFPAQTPPSARRDLPAHASSPANDQEVPPRPRSKCRRIEPERTICRPPPPWICKGVSATLQSGRYTLSYPRIASLDMKGCICHFTKWKILPFTYKGTVCIFSTFAHPNDHLKENEKPLQKNNFLPRRWRKHGKDPFNNWQFVGGLLLLSSLPVRGRPIPRGLYRHTLNVSGKLLTSTTA